MSFIAREEPFICDNCHKSIEPLGKGTYRNHCSHCLYSKHVDSLGPGDRQSICHGLMKPVGLDQNTKKGFVLIHECVKCGKMARNRAAPDDNLLNI